MTTQHAKSNAREGDGVAGLPPLPSAARTSLSWMGDTNPSHYYTAAQMHAYALSAMQAQQGAEPVAWDELQELESSADFMRQCKLQWLRFIDEHPGGQHQKKRAAARKRAAHFANAEAALSGAPR